MSLTSTEPTAPVAYAACQFKPWGVWHAVHRTLNGLGRTLCGLRSWHAGRFEDHDFMLGQMPTRECANCVRIVVSAVPDVT